MKKLVLLILLALTCRGQESGTEKSADAINADLTSKFPSGVERAINAEKVRVQFRDVVASTPNTLAAYSDPSWISSLAWAKLTSVPNTIAGLGVLNGAALDAIAANGSAYYLSRANHTGMQAISTVTGLQTALDGKSGVGHGHAIADTTGLQAALDAKAASAHTHPASQIIDSTVTGRAVMTAADAATARAAIGAGTSSFDGAYGSLSSTPTLGTAAALNVAASGNAASGEVVKGSDTRLSDARAPTAHASTHAAAGSDPLAITASQVSGLAASATTDTTNASNITSGTLSAARLPASGVTAATYGSPSSVAQIALDAAGRATSAGNVTIAITQSQVTNLVTDLAAKVATTRTISTTAPLAGGGDLSADRTLSISAATTSAAGVVQLATSAQTTAGLAVQASDTRLSDPRTPTSHTHAESEITGLVADLAGKEPPTDDLLHGVSVPKTTALYLREDFALGAATNLWSFTSAGTGANAGTSTGDASHPGVVVLSDGTTSSGTAGMRTAVTAQFLFGGLAWELFLRVKSAASLSDGTNTYTFSLGFGDSASGLPTDGAYFLHDSTSGNWQAATRSNTSSTSASGGSAIAISTGTWYDLRISVNSAGTTVTFYVYSGGSWTSIGSTSTNIPTSVNREFGLAGMILATAGTASRTWTIDKLILWAQ